jgi:hypothetical protein
MLQDLGHDLEIFQLHSETFSRNPRISDELVDIFTDIILLWAETVHFLNRNKHGGHDRSPRGRRIFAKTDVGIGSTEDRAWQQVQEKFVETLKRIRKRSQRIKEKASISAQVQGISQANLLEELDRLGLLPSSSHASLHEDVFPCENIPFQRNKAFFGREFELGEIRKNLDDDSPGNSLKSFALCGTGGIGKTQTAIRYAYEAKDAGTEAILWFDCETGLSLAGSFTDAASMLQLEGATDDQTSDQNRFIVLRWLRRTSKAHVVLL